LSTAERLQKVLARQGLGSRRQLEHWIVAGRVKVNGQLAELGMRVTSNDRIYIDGRPLRLTSSQSTRVLIYNKPEGEICSRHDPQGRKTVFDALPKLKQGRWLGVGRLDINSQGLLLFTNNGELAHRLMHPSQQIEREYAVRVQGTVTEQLLTHLKQGVLLEDGPARFITINFAGGDGRNQWYHVTLCEGRQREVRRLWQSQPDIQVSRLIRIRYGHVQLPRNLPRGRWRELTGAETKALDGSAGLSHPVNKAKSQIRK
jgi:23S rRNA pseudouridine2605 synthase